MLTADLAAPYYRVLWLFDVECWKSCACHEKVTPSHPKIPKCCACHATWFAKSEKSELQRCNPSHEMSAPTSKHEHVKVPNMLPLPRKMQLFFKSPTPANVFGKYLKKITGFLILFATCRIPCACHERCSSDVEKWPGHVGILRYWLTSRHRATTRAHFSTSQLPKAARSKSGSVLTLFWTLQIGTAPLRELIFV